MRCPSLREIADFKPRSLRQPANVANTVDWDDGDIVSREGQARRGMILSVFGDESADQTNQRVFAVSGVMGNDDEWQVTKEAWLERTGGKIFHAAECETEYANDPDKAKHHENLKLYKDLCQILAKSPLTGIGVALDLAAHREFFGESLNDIGYYKCLTDVLWQLTLLAENFNAKIPTSDHPEDEPVKLAFTFDSRIQSNGNVGTLYAGFINQPEFATNIESLLGSKISFDCRTNPRIQIADLLVRETMKELDRRITGHFPCSRLSYQALEETQKFIFLYRDREFCKQWREHKEEIEAHYGMSPRDYVNWLIDTGRVQNRGVHDNWGNRFEYLAYKNKRMMK